MGGDVSKLAINPLDLDLALDKNGDDAKKMAPYKEVLELRKLLTKGESFHIPLPFENKFARVPVRLIDARWLLALEHTEGGAPCRQQLEESTEAPFFSEGDKHSWWPLDFNRHVVVVVSYPWLDKAHPDPDGVHLFTVQVLLRHLLRTAQNEKQFEASHSTRLPG
jgi:hypothetical protein